MLGARPSTCGHVVVSEDILQLFLGFDGVWGEACELIHRSWRVHDGEIVCHDSGISPDSTHNSGIGL